MDIRRRQLCLLSGVLYSGYVFPGTQEKGTQNGKAVQNKTLQVRGRYRCDFVRIHGGNVYASRQRMYPDHGRVDHHRWLGYTWYHIFPYLQGREIKRRIFWKIIF